MQDEVRFKLDERGLVVTVVTDDVLFGEFYDPELEKIQYSPF